MSFGVVPASNSLRGPTGYFAAESSADVTAAEERQSLLQVMGMRDVFIVSKLQL